MMRPVLGTTVGWDAGEPPSRRPRHGQALLVGAAAASLAGYLVAPPPVPDLAAQVARADVVQRVGETVWWLGWFGGLHLPIYSVTSPSLMAAVGAPATGVLATATAALAMARLLRPALRPRLAAACFFLTDLANLLDGRVTFAVSLALGLCCLLSLTISRPRLRAVVAGALGLLTCVTSPLGGLFLGLAAVTLVIVRGAHWRAALHLSLLLVSTLLATAVLFPGAGRMPFDLRSFLPAVACTAAVAVACREPWLRTGAVGYLILQLLFLVHPTAVGVNITRLAWIFTLPLAVAYGRLPRRGLAIVAVAGFLLPAADLASQLQTATDASAHEAFYRPLLAALAADGAAQPATRGQRVEVVDTRGHWASVYVARHYGLARGWERQADRSFNPLFYGDGRLDDASYRGWLTQLAVGWVAVPRAALDYASVREAALIARHPTYLRPIWSSGTWTLYRVVDAAPLATPATVLRVDDRVLTLGVVAPVVHLAVRWSPYLVVTDRSGSLVG
ncbi:MAG: hypothetical protein ACXV2H_06495, partial [Actinomycetes bacterium]